jgi:hypothetical protein
MLRSQVLRMLGPLESVTGALMYSLSANLLFAIVNRLVGLNYEPNPQSIQSQ